MPRVSIPGRETDTPPRVVGGADLAKPRAVSAGDGMAPRQRVQDIRFPPFAPIPGRGLPRALPGEIPTRRVRILRAGGAFVTSLAAAASLSLGPAVVLAKLGSDTTVVVVVSVTDERPTLPIAQVPTDLIGRCQLVRSRFDWGARGPMIIASGTGSPRNRPRDLGVKPRGQAGPFDRRSGSSAARRRRWRTGAEAPLTPARHPRPPPLPGERTPYRVGPLQASAPATPSLSRWCGPASSFPRV